MSPFIVAMAMSAGLLANAAIPESVLRTLPCFDGERNGNETDVDCGGRASCSCPPETPWWACNFLGVEECIGRACGPCADGQRCKRGGDCESRVCRPDNLFLCAIIRACDGTCAAPSCTDHVQNGGETDLNCGRVCPTKCKPGQGCEVDADCETDACKDDHCQEPPSRDPGPTPSCTQRDRCIIFVSSTAHDGDLGGLAGADGICNALANDAGLPGTYQAWLCDGVTAPADRCMRSTKPYVRPDGLEIAGNWFELTHFPLKNPINVNEYGNDVSWFVDSLPWTYVAPDGTCDDATYYSPGFRPCPPLSRCKLNCAADGGNEGWTSNSAWAQGAKGDVNLLSSFWTDGVTGLCSSPNERIYCIEQ